MYANHCHFVLEDGGAEVIYLKLKYLPRPDMLLKLRPLSTGVETTYEVKAVSLVMEEVTTHYPGTLPTSTDGWEHEWVIEVEEVV